MNLLGISGSLRRDSYNTWLLRAAQDLLPAGVALDIYVGHNLPLYNADLDIAVKPPAVVELLERIRAADALLFATPEYNYGIPGVLKNAIDWASRPAFTSVLARKPAGMMSATRGAVGGARAQAQLRSVLAATLTPVLPWVDMLVPAAHEKFSAEGALIDEVTRGRVQKYLRGLVTWAAEQTGRASDQAT